MIYLAVIVVCLVVLVVRERDHDKRIALLLGGAEQERQVLLDRIERPGTVIAPALLTEPEHDEEPDEFEKLRREWEGVSNGSD